MDNELRNDMDFTEDEELKQVLDYLRTAMSNSKPAIINPEKVKQVLDAYKLLRRSAKGNSVSVSYKLNEPFRNVGSVSVVGKNVVFKDPGSFLQAVGLANNFEVYPKTDGTVQLNLTFYGLTKPVE